MRNIFSYNTPSDNTASFNVENNISNITFESATIGSIISTTGSFSSISTNTLTAGIVFIGSIKTSTILSSRNIDVTGLTAGSLNSFDINPVTGVFGTVGRDICVKYFDYKCW